MADGIAAGVENPPNDAINPASGFERLELLVEMGCTIPAKLTDFLPQALAHARAIGVKIPTLLAKAAAVAGKGDNDYGFAKINDAFHDLEAGHLGRLAPNVIVELSRLLAKAVNEAATETQRKRVREEAPPGETRQPTRDTVRSTMKAMIGEKEDPRCGPMLIACLQRQQTVNDLSLPHDAVKLVWEKVGTEPARVSLATLLVSNGANTAIPGIENAHYRLLVWAFLVDVAAALLGSMLAAKGTPMQYEAIRRIIADDPADKYFETIAAAMGGNLRTIENLMKPILKEKDKEKDPTKQSRNPRGNARRNTKQSDAEWKSPFYPEALNGSCRHCNQAGHASRQCPRTDAEVLESMTDADRAVKVRLVGKRT